MSQRAGRLKFGVFIPPQNKVGLNPHLAITRAIELIVHLDRLGFDEAWVGEHHSGGAEIVASPELVIANAVARTSSIRLGTGVISLPYHHPFQVAERIVLLDHLTDGRTMFGMGPGQLPTDASMHGIDATQLRPRMEEALDVIVPLLAGETVSCEGSWFTCNQARLQLEPYSDLELSVVGTISPSGPKLAGRHGLGLLSLAATDPAGTDRLPEHWGIMNEEADRHGHAIDRSQWRLMGPMHIAETVEQAKRECRYGLRWQYDYLAHITPSAIEVEGGIDALAEVINETGRGVIGTPEMAIAQIERLLDRSGGFGTYLFQGADFARWDATLRSYELFAEEVMPHFDGQLKPVIDSYERVVAASEDNKNATAAARLAAQDQWQRERAEGSGAGSSHSRRESSR
jgi:limonene 1,2-monooxygenase